MRLFRPVTCATRSGHPPSAHNAHDSNEPRRWIRRRKRGDNSKMKNSKRACTALLTALVFIAGNMGARPQSAQVTGDQAKNGASATKPAEKKSADSAPTTKKNNSGNAASRTSPTAPTPASAAAPPGNAPASAPSSATAATQKTSTAKKCGHGLGKYRVRRVSWARHTLVWQNQAGQVHDGSRRHQGRLQGFRKKLEARSFIFQSKKERRK